MSSMMSWSSFAVRGAWTPITHDGAVTESPRKVIMPQRRPQRTSVHPRALVSSRLPPRRRAGARALRTPAHGTLRHHKIAAGRNAVMFRHPCGVPRPEALADRVDVAHLRSPPACAMPAFPRDYHSGPRALSIGVRTREEIARKGGAIPLRDLRIS